MAKKLRCYFGSHKWVRMQTANEGAYKCQRCGERHYGRRPRRRLEAFVDGGGMGGGDGGGMGGGDGGGV